MLRKRPYRSQFNHLLEAQPFEATAYQLVDARLHATNMADALLTKSYQNWINIAHTHHPERHRSISMNAALIAWIFMIATSIGFPRANAAASSQSVAAFCKAHPNLDFPSHAFYGSHAEQGRLPQDVTAVEASNWRCMDGKAYVCDGGASGSACMKMNPSRTPSALIRETCEDAPGRDFVAMASIGNSASTWRCQGQTARIIATVPLDTRGFMQQTWALLYDEHGKINSNIELNADPR